MGGEDHRLTEVPGMQLLKTTIAAAALSVGLAVSASAMPVPRLSTDMVTPQVDQVRIVCDRWGRCWRTGWGWRRHWGWHPGWRRSYAWHPGWHRRWHPGWGWRRW